MTTLVVLLLMPAPLDAPPGALKLLAGSEEFRKADGSLVTLDGVVERNPSTGRIGAGGPDNLFRLRWQDATGKEVVRELYVADLGFRVSDHVGRKVRVHCKLVERKAGKETIQDLWPAWLQSLSGPLVLGPDGVYARCDWQPEEARRRGTRQYVFRSAEQLAEALRVRGDSAPKTASEELARRLAVPAIDWQKHMLLCVSAGLQTTVEALAVTGVKEEAGVLRVRYRLVPAKGAGLGFGCPAQTVLVSRSTAEVRFEQELKTK
jgi:hypothetical protein